ncbi:MAG TPA: enoyl-CoA hydratase-related protein [Acidimicrobiales bacterium]
MSYRAIRFEVTERVAVITLDRPEVRNAFNGVMGRELAEAYRRCDADDGVGAVVVTGAPPAFCAGADLSEGSDTFRPRDPDGFSAAATTMPAWDVGKLVVAAVNGHALGVGLTLALQCDIRLFASDASYGVVQVRRGMMGDGYSHWTLPRLAGLSAAADILLTGRTFDGHEAQRLGICSRTLPNDQVLPAAMELARDVAEHAAPLSVAVSKRLLWESWERSADQVEAAETEGHHFLMARPDAREGVEAFLQHRPPRWTGSVAKELPPQPDPGSSPRQAPGVT